MSKDSVFSKMLLLLTKAMPAKLVAFLFGVGESIAALFSSISVMGFDDLIRLSEKSLKL